MKTRKLAVMIAAMMALPLWLSAQSPADALFDKYSGQDGFTSVHITQHMFRLFADIAPEEDEDGWFHRPWKRPQLHQDRVGR